MRFLNMLPTAGVVVAALTLGLILGWWGGSSATCGPNCDFDVVLFDAIGTWVGGVGVATVAGLYAIYRVRADKAARQATAEAEALTLAQLCTLRFRPLTKFGIPFSQLHISFSNKLPVSVNDVSILLDGEFLRTDKQVAPGRGWGIRIPMTKLGLKPSFPTEEAAQAALRPPIKSRISFRFSINGFVFSRCNDEVTLATTKSQ